MSYRTVFFCSAFALLGGCAELRPTPISYTRLESVEADVKRQIGLYQASAEWLHDNPSLDPARIEANKAGYVCGNGKIDFDIDSAQLDITSTFDQTDAASLSAVIPIQVATISPGVSMSSDTQNAQELKMNLYNLHHYSGAQLDGDRAPITNLLLSLRKAMILASTKPGICVYDYDFRKKVKSSPPQKADSSDPNQTTTGNTIKIAIAVTDDNKVQLGAGVSVVSLLFSREWKAVDGNAVTVTFKQRDAPKVVALNKREDPRKKSTVGKGLYMEQN